MQPRKTFNSLYILKKDSGIIFMLNIYKKTKRFTNDVHMYICIYLYKQLETKTNFIYIYIAEIYVVKRPLTL